MNCERRRVDSVIVDSDTGDSVFVEAAMVVVMVHSISLCLVHKLTSYSVLGMFGIS